MPGGIHRTIRRVTRNYPFRTWANFFNVCVGRLAFDRPEAVWEVTAAYAGHPAMELNVSTPFQRKIYLFPRAYARYWYGLPLATYMRSCLAPGDVFMDIGSNVGYYTLLAASLVGPTGRVVAFEPDPITFEALRRSIALNRLDHATCVNVALSDFEGEAEFYRTEATAHSLVAETAADKRFRGVTRVKVTSLSRWLEQTEAPRSAVRLLKVDVEGEEPRTTAGMVPVLPRLGYPAIWAEVRGPSGSKRAPNTFAPMCDLLEPLGYRPHRWLDQLGPAIGREEVQKQEDVVFVRPPSRG
jgi:FkbM family methyltransferase